MITNDERAERAKSALMTYLGTELNHYVNEPETAIQDLLTDLMHLHDSLGTEKMHSHDELRYRATRQYEAEKSGDT